MYSLLNFGKCLITTSTVQKCSISIIPQSFLFGCLFVFHPLPLPQAQTITDLFLATILLPFLEFYVNGIIQYRILCWASFINVLMWIDFQMLNRDSIPGGKHT